MIGHSGARAESAFTRVFDTLWLASPESRATAAEYGFRVSSLTRFTRNDETS